MPLDHKAGAYAVAAKGAPEEKDDDDDDKPDAPDEKAKPGSAKGDQPKSSDAKSEKPDKDDDNDEDDDDKPETLEEKYENHFPQEVFVSDVVGKALLEGDNTQIGTIEAVARTSDGKILLILPYGGFFGFGKHRVAVRLEAVASIGTALISVEQDRAAYEASPRWQKGSETILAPNDPVRIAITRH